MRLIDEKLRVYSRVITLIGELPGYRNRLDKARKDMEPYRGVDLKTVSDPSEQAKLLRLVERRAERSDEAYQRLAELVTLLNALRIWGPTEIARLAIELNDAYRDKREADVEELEVKLIIAIRRDLRIDGR